MSTISKTQPQSSTSSGDSIEIVRSGFGTQATAWETFQNAMVITRREVRDSFRDWRIIVPIVILTLCFPALANVASAAFISFFDDYGADGETLVEAFLPLMPMIVGFFPVSISLVIALETFVGEKERRSLEPLLSTPLTNTELYMGKVLAATLPPLFAAYLGIFIYLAGLILGAQQWRPELILVLQIVALTTVQAVVMVTGAVVISSQTTSTRAANLLASVIILPMSLLVIFESIIMVQPDRRHVLWWVIVGLLVVIVLLVRTGTRIFNREELLGRAVDELNLKWMLRVFWDQVRGISHEARDAYENRGEPLPRHHTPWLWYRHAVFPTFKSLRAPMLVMSIAIVAAFVGGWYLSTQYTLPLDRQPPDDTFYAREAFETSLTTPWLIDPDFPPTVAAAPAEPVTFTVQGAWQGSLNALQTPPATVENAPWLYSDEELLNNLRDLWETASRDPGWVMRALTQNMRVLAVAFILGTFTFGVLSILIVSLPFGILGYIFGNIFASSINPIPFVLAVVTHGVAEIPAILLAGVLILRVGSITVGKMDRMTVGEVWLRAMGDAVKLYFAIVLPLLVIAATLEVMATPRAVEWALEIGF